MRLLALLLTGCLAVFAFNNARAYEPESGIWWNPQESGTGYAIEVQDNMMAVTIYGGDEAGYAKWYTAVSLLRYEDGGVYFEADILSFHGLQPIGRPYVRGSRVTEPSYGKLRIAFDPSNNRRATMTWPTGRVVPIQRQEFYFVRQGQDTGGVNSNTLKMLGEWNIVADISSNDGNVFPFLADILVLDYYEYDADDGIWFYDGCRPDDAQVGGCSEFALNHHDAAGFYEPPSAEFPNGVQVILVKDGASDGRMWYALYELAIGTNDGSGWFTLYPQGGDPYYYDAPTRAFRTASRTFVQEGSGPAKQADEGKGRIGGVAVQLAAQGALPVAAKKVSAERAKHAAARLPLIRALEARLD